MKQYKYDTHVHTSEVSPCGKVDAKTAVRLYKQAGYDGIVITDHYFEGYFKTLTGNWNDKIDAYLEGYRNAYSEGQKIGLKVISGMELCFIENNNDYLVYGFDETFLRQVKNLYELDIKSFSTQIKNNSMVIYQAHPFRPFMAPANPLYLDGIEVFNGNPRQNSMNHKAKLFAEENNLGKLSGSDFHQMQDLASGGIILPEAPENSFEFAEMLMRNQTIGLIEGKE